MENHSATSNHTSWSTFHVVGRVASIPYRGVCWLVDWFVIRPDPALHSVHHEAGENTQASPLINDESSTVQTRLDYRTDTPHRRGQPQPHAIRAIPTEALQSEESLPVVMLQHERIQYRRQRNLNRQRSAFERVSTNRSFVRRQSSRGIGHTIYLRSAGDQRLSAAQSLRGTRVNPDDAGNHSQMPQEIGPSEGFQHHLVPAAIVHEQPLDHHLPPVPEDLPAIQAARHSPYMLHTSPTSSFVYIVQPVHWRSHEPLPPSPENQQQLPSGQRLHQGVPPPFDPRPSNYQPQPHQSQSRTIRRRTRTTELGDELVETPPPAYGNW